MKGNLKTYRTKLRRCRSEILYLALLAVCLVPNVLTAFHTGLGVAFGLLDILLPLALYTLLLSAVRRPGVGVLLMLPVMFLSAFQLTLYCLFRDTTISVDMWLNVQTTNSREVGELLHNLVAAMTLVAVCYLPVVATGAVALIRGWRLRQRSASHMRRGAVVALVLCVPFGIASFAGVPRPVWRSMFPADAIHNLAIALQRQRRTADYAATSRHFSFEARSLADSALRQLHIIVIGETSRADNWHLDGYPRHTTDALDTLEGLSSWRRAFSQSNVTHKSVPMLLSHLDASDFRDSIFQVKGIISAFSEAGYATAFFSSQQRNNSFIDFFGEEAETCVFIRDALPPDVDVHDRKLLRLIAGEISKRHPRQLIVVHTYGSHFNYRDRYGDADRRYLPDSYPSASGAYRHALVNAYDNSIVATSRLLRDIVELARRSGVVATVAYTSDHGEDLFDRGSRRFLHASAVPSYYQLHVPLLLWQSPGWRRAHPQMAEALRRNTDSVAVTSSALFHTVLDMADISTPYLDRTRSLVSPAYRPAPLLYLDDRNEAVSLRGSGMPKADIDAIEGRGR